MKKDYRGVWAKAGKSDVQGKTSVFGFHSWTSVTITRNVLKTELIGLFNGLEIERRGKSKDTYIFGLGN